MTTVASIIQSALRETNLIPIGGVPTTIQSTEAFALLSTIVASVLGNEAGENLNPMPLGQGNINSPSGYPWWANQLPANVFVPVNTRIMCNLTGAGTVNLSPNPHDGARMGIVDVSHNFNTFPLTIKGNGRMIEGATSMTYNVASTIKEWIYREDLGNWVAVIPLDIAGQMPWPPEFDNMFIIMLAMRLNPRYGQSTDPASMLALKASMSQFSARYKQSNTQVSSEIGLLYLTNRATNWNNGNWSYSDPNALFNSGYPYV